MGATKRAAPGSGLGAASLVSVANGSESSWCLQNERHIAKADTLIRGKLSDAQNRGIFTDTTLVDEIFNNILMSNLTAGDRAEDGDNDNNGSVLLLGEAKSGKTHAVEYCLQKLREVRGDGIVVLRAYGGSYASDVECIRHLAAQVQGGQQLELEPPPKNASFEQGMEWLRCVMREGFEHATAVVVVLEKFEHFCSKARQTLLYNLYDIAQESSVRLSIIGTSEKTDVMDSLEKRIKSRFSMRHLHAYRPTTMERLFKVLLEKLRCPADDALPAPFVRKFHSNVEAALRAKAAEWSPHLDAGMPPMWFLGKCLPVWALLRGPEKSKTTEIVATTADSPPKRARLQFSFTAHEVDRVLISGLCDDDHIILLALLRLQDREVSQTLATVLHEVELLHERGGMVSRFSRDRYAEAFSRLLQQRLVETASPTAGDPPRQYMPVQSLVGRLYGKFVSDIGREQAGHAASGDMWSNPLTSLPEVVQQWAVRQICAKH